MGLDLVTLAAAKAYTDKMIPQGGGGLAGFELIDTIDFSTEEMGQKKAGKSYELDNVTEIVTIWRNMKNAGESNSVIFMQMNGMAGFNVAARTARNSADPINGYTYIKVFEGAGTLAFMANGANSATNYGFGAQALPHNLFPNTNPITKLKIYNPDTAYYAISGTIEVYVR